MAIQTRCDDCGAILKIADEHAGKRARCPQCRTEYTVPSQTDQEKLDSVCHFCGAPTLPVDSTEEKFTTCAECRESIEENQEELAWEQEQPIWVQKITNIAMIVFGLVIVAVILVTWLYRRTE